MSRTVSELLADLLGPTANACPAPTPAKTANPAKTRAGIDSPAESTPCEGLRKVANPQAPSQEFAALRSTTNPAQSEHSCGSSQLSQVSQGVPRTIPPDRAYRLSPSEADEAHAEPWGDADCGRFVQRVTLFLRRGIGATDADDLAERLHLRDVRADDRRLCVECRHMAGRPGAWRCGNARAAGVGPELPGELVMQLQRCAGFEGAA